jgi:diadenosine tetraphosphate (Ap4A) HIT family hydrolase
MSLLFWPATPFAWDVPHFHYHLVPMFDYYDLDPKRVQLRSHEESAGIQQKIIVELSALEF